jgi:hypothetical protein
MTFFGGEHAILHIIFRGGGARGLFGCVVIKQVWKVLNRDGIPFDPDVTEKARK